MKQSESGKGKLIWALVILYTLFIFSNSLQTGETSGHLSGQLTKAILGFLSSLGIDLPYDGAHHFIRKAAHFSEYFILGLLVSHAQKKAKILNFDYLCIALWTLAVPCIDETLQLFTAGRAGSPYDVLLDMCGCLCGAMVYRIITKR